MTWQPADRIGRSCLVTPGLPAIKGWGGAEVGGKIDLFKEFVFLLAPPHCPLGIRIFARLMVKIVLFKVLAVARFLKFQPQGWDHAGIQIIAQGWYVLWMAEWNHKIGPFSCFNICWVFSKVFRKVRGEWWTETVCDMLVPEVSLMIITNTNEQKRKAGWRGGLCENRWCFSLSVLGVAVCFCRWMCIYFPKLVQCVLEQMSSKGFSALLFSASAPLQHRGRGRGLQKPQLFSSTCQTSTAWSPTAALS